MADTAAELERATLAHEVSSWAHWTRDATARRDQAIAAMRADGASLREIAQAAGMAHASIVRILERHRNPPAP